MNYVVLGIVIYFKIQRASTCPSVIEFDDIHRVVESLKFKLETSQDNNIVIINSSEAETWNFLPSHILLYQKFYISMTNKPAEPDACWKVLERHEFNGIKITAIITDEPQTAHKVVDGKYVLVGGFSTEIFHSFRDVLNFSYDTVIENPWPKQLENGSWTGMGKILMEHRADIAIVLITYLPSRVKDFSILMSTSITPLIAAFYQPPSQSMRNVYISPFNNDVWLGFLITLFAILLFLVFVEATKNQSLKESNEVCGVSSILWILSQIAQQGWFPFGNGGNHRPPTSIKLICWIVVPLNLFIMLTYYEAALYTFLSMANVPIKHVQDLLHSNFYLVADNSSQTVMQLVKLVKNPKTLLQGNDERLEQLSHKRWVIKQAGDAKNDLISKSAALVTFPDTVILESKRAWGFGDPEICGVSESTKLNILPFSLPYAAGMLMPKHSPYRNVFNIRLINVMESGLLKKYIDNYEVFSPRCLRPEVRNMYKGVPELVVLNMADMFPAFLIFIVGFALSIVGFVAERIVFKILNLPTQFNRSIIVLH